MISEAVLDRAVGEGLITAEQAAGLLAIAAGRVPLSRTADLAPDREKLRFISGFGDIFVTIGLALFLYAGSVLLLQTGYRVAALAVTAAVAWLLAEFFVRRRRMALPGIMLLGAFAGFVLLAAAAQLGILDHPVAPYTSFDDALLLMGRANPGATALAAAITAGAGALHYVRFRVPITVAAAAGGLVATLVVLAGAWAPAFMARATEPVVLGCGIGCFAGAMHYDLSDPVRATRRTDIAFWLHLLAAPLIVHSLFAIVGPWALSSTEALFVLAVFGLLSAIAILVDRRALLVSGLLYAALAFGSLFGGAGFGTRTLLITVLALGALILLLSAGWQNLRRALLRLLPADLSGRLPHPSVLTP